MENKEKIAKEAQQQNKRKETLAMMMLRSLEYEKRYKQLNC